MSCSAFNSGFNHLRYDCSSCSWGQSGKRVVDLSNLVLFTIIEELCCGLRRCCKGGPASNKLNC